MDPAPLLDEPVFGAQDVDPRGHADFWTFYRNTIGKPSDRQSAPVPDFVMLAPPKTGTSWLTHHLSTHPAIFVPPEKEVRYFDVLWRYHDIDWYLSKFTPGNDRVRGDCSPQFAWLPAPAIEVLRDLNPRLKLLFIARRQPERAWSQLRNMVRFREGRFRPYGGSFEALSPKDILADLLSDISLSASDYVGILRRWLQFFPDDQFSVHYFEHMIEEPVAHLMQIYRFLGVNAEIDSEAAELRDKIHEGAPYRVPDWAQRTLADIYAGRQTEAEAYLKATFDLETAWQRLTPPVPTSPILVQALDDRCVYFYRGQFRVLSRSMMVRDDNLGAAIDAAEDEIVSGNFLTDALEASSQRTVHQLRAEPSLEDQRLFRIFLSLQGRDFAHLVDLVDTYRGFNLLVYLGRWYGLRQSVGRVALSTGDEALRATYSARDVVIGDSRGEVESRIDQVEPSIGPKSPHVTMAGETTEYNFLRIKTDSPETDRYYAVAKALGPVELMVERFGERDLPPFLVSGDSVESVREKASTHERLPLEHIGSVGKYNILRSPRGFVALAQALGPVACFLEQVGERDLPPVVLTGDTEDEVRRKIGNESGIPWNPDRDLTQ